MRNSGAGAPPVKARINFWIDVLIGVAFVAAAASGVVLLVMGSGGGYRGGRGTAGIREVLFLGRTAWKDLHNWSGIAMSAGVLGHLVLHARWIGCMSRNLFRKTVSRRAAVKDCPVEA
ncbi:MAG: hypothetical protein A2177_01530 [Spirochaetes bacterium RBG_13_68_11]|nr:MAG: hypothetical protein A2177_01530 [Spirochaetes bacterium RBG_13_68_11]